MTNTTVATAAAGTWETKAVRWPGAVSAAADRRTRSLSMPWSIRSSAVTVSCSGRTAATPARKSSTVAMVAPAASSRDSHWSKKWISWVTQAQIRP